jgi:hypothetical protein
MTRAENLIKWHPLLHFNFTKNDTNAIPEALISLALLKNQNVTRLKAISSAVFEVKYGYGDQNKMEMST